MPEELKATSPIEQRLIESPQSDTAADLPASEISRLKVSIDKALRAFEALHSKEKLAGTKNFLELAQACEVLDLHALMIFVKSNITEAMLAGTVAIDKDALRAAFEKLIPRRWQEVQNTILSPLASDKIETAPYGSAANQLCEAVFLFLYEDTPVNRLKFFFPSVKRLLLVENDSAENTLTEVEEFSLTDGIPSSFTVYLLDSADINEKLAGTPISQWVIAGENLLLIPNVLEATASAPIARCINWAMELQDYYADLYKKLRTHNEELANWCRAIDYVTEALTLRRALQDLREALFSVSFRMTGHRGDLPTNEAALAAEEALALFSQYLMALPAEAKRIHGDDYKMSIEAILAYLGNPEATRCIDTALKWIQAVLDHPNESLDLVPELNAEEISQLTRGIQLAAQGLQNKERSQKTLGLPTQTALNVIPYLSITPPGRSAYPDKKRIFELFLAFPYQAIYERLLCKPSVFVTLITQGNLSELLKRFDPKQTKTFHCALAKQSPTLIRNPGLFVGLMAALPAAERPLIIQVCKEKIKRWLRFNPDFFGKKLPKYLEPSLRNKLIMENVGAVLSACKAQSAKYYAVLPWLTEENQKNFLTQVFEREILNKEEGLGIAMGLKPLNNCLRHWFFEKNLELILRNPTIVNGGQLHLVLNVLVWNDQKTLIEKLLSSDACTFKKHSLDFESVMKKMDLRQKAWIVKTLEKTQQFPDVQNGAQLGAIIGFFPTEQQEEIIRNIFEKNSELLSDPYGFGALLRELDPSLHRRVFNLAKDSLLPNIQSYRDVHLAIEYLNPELKNDFLCGVRSQNPVLLKEFQNIEDLKKRLCENPESEESLNLFEKIKESFQEERDSELRFFKDEGWISREKPTKTLWKKIIEFALVDWMADYVGARMILQEAAAKNGMQAGSKRSGFFNGR